MAMPNCQIMAVIEEELKLKPTNYSVADCNSMYGHIATNLGLENVKSNREYLRDVIKQQSLELLQTKCHNEIEASFSSSVKPNLKPSARHAKSIYGEVATDLNIPNIESIRVCLSRWRKRFPTIPVSNEGSIDITDKEPTRNKGGRPRISSEMEPPSKRRRAQQEVDAEIDDENFASSLPASIKEFMTAVHKYPERTCDVCHRLQYTLKGLPTSEITEDSRHHFDADALNIHVCDRCFQALKKKKTPPQAFFNNMQQQCVPGEIKFLSQAEVQLISQVRPFMKIFYLSKGRGQQAIKGSAIHFPNSVNDICQHLPLSNISSEFVVVHERIEGLQNQHDFRVRQSSVLRALHWLKANNWLYKNVSICERDETILQPITVEAVISRTCVPQKNVPASMLAYLSIGPNKRILRASCHQSSEGRFLEAGRGKQCTAMAMACIAYSSVQNPTTWTTDTLDEILLRGDKLYESKATHGQLLLPLEAQGPIDGIFGAITVEVTVDETNAQIFNGQLNRLACQMESQVLRLPLGLQNLIDSEHRSAVLTVGEYSMAIIKGDNTVYLFDSHSRGPHGRVAGNGLACMIEFETSLAATEISKLVHINLEPKRIPGNDQSDKTHYLFSIVPVKIETEYIRDDDNQSVDNFHASNSQPETDSSIEDRLSNLLGSSTGFGENVLVDSLLHNIDYNVPEIEDIVPVTTTQSTPTVTVQKEKGRPLYPNQEEYLEELSFVSLFPYGKGGVSAVRPVQITPLDYYQARVMSSDTRFWDNSYLFYALSRMEEHKVKQKIAVCGQMQTLQSNGPNAVEYPGLTNVHLYMSAIRGSASYWKKYTGDLIAMLAQLGISPIFFTMSSDDLNSTDSIFGLLICDAMRGEADDELLSSLRQLIQARNYAELEQRLKSLSYEVKTDLLNRHPVQAARHYNHRVNNFMKLLKKCGKEIFGYEVVDYSYRVEFQNRGSPHIHMLLWFLNSPTDYHSAEGKAFIERNVSCSIPDDDEELKALVLKYQQHKHTRTCFPRSNFCRFDFPRKVSKETVILEEDDIHRNKGRFCILRRTEQETYINNYHPILLKILKCNMDIQIVTDANAIAYYIAKYISKAEPTDIQEEIQRIMQQLQSNSKASYHQMATSIATKILNKRQVSAPEAAYRLCHLKLRHSSRGFVFIPSYHPSKRLHIIQKETIGNTNVKMGMSLIEKYTQRPANLVEICLLEFAAMYSPAKKDSSDFDQDDDEDEEEQFHSYTIRLNNGTLMKSRKRPAIVKYPNFDAIKQSDDYYYSLMLLYFPFINEQDITGDFPTVMDAFKENSSSFRNATHADFLRPNLTEEIDRALNRIQNFDDELEPIVEGEDFLQNDFEENIPEAEIFQPLNDVGNLHERYHTLSDEQKEVFQKVKLNLDSTETDPMLAFISGSGGTGKSYLIDTVASLIASYSLNDKNLLLKAAPTGLSALNINATTIHRAFKLPVQRGYIAPYTPLSSRQVQELRSVLRHVRWIIIDEISMVSYQSLRMIHLRLCEAMNGEEPFGGLNVLVLGDLMQFRPIRASWIFKPPSTYLHEINLWKLFDFYELHKNHRQTGDRRYLELLERLRFGQCTEEDLSLLQSRIFDSEDLEDSEEFSKFADALSLFPTNADVNAFNAKKTESLKKELLKMNKKTYVLRAKDVYATGTHFDEPCPETLVPKDERKTAGIPSSIELGIGSRIMLRRNWSVTDGLVNGSTGTVVGIKWTALRDEPLQDGDLPEILIVRFDGNMGGRHKDINGYVRVQCSTFEFPGNRQTLIKRRAFAIVLCWALVFHKCQGLTLHLASIELSRSQFAKAMSYVVLSRLKSSGGLHLMKNLKDSNILTLKKDGAPCDSDALAELYRFRLMKIGIAEEEINGLLKWIVEYPLCLSGKHWVCYCKCRSNNKVV